MYNVNTHDDDGPHSKISLPPHELETVSKVVNRENFKSLCGDSVCGVSGQFTDWSHQSVDIQGTWRKHKVSGEGVTVAVLDTGADGKHADLVISEGRDFTGSAHGWQDVQGHGTHVSGTIGAKNNGIGVVGAAPNSRIIAGKVLSDNGSGTYVWIASGIRWAADKNASVINMSLGGSGPIANVVRNAIDYAISKGVIVCVAAGNSGPSEGTVGSPGNYSRCVTVGATDSRRVPAIFSSRGETVDVAAPGVEILSTYPGNRLARLSGTSMATPLVSGIAALFVEKCRRVGVTPNQALFEKLATVTAVDIASPGKDTSTGYGLIQPCRILDEVDRLAPRQGLTVPAEPKKSFTVTVRLSSGEIVKVTDAVGIEID